MSDVAKKYQDELPDLKKCVDTFKNYFRDNHTRYREFRNSVYNTSLTDEDRAICSINNKPFMEFNIQEAYISRQVGEFSSQEPSFTVSSDDDKDIDIATIDLVEGYIRHQAYKSNQDGCEYNTFAKQMSGGFSVWKVWTEYTNANSFNQDLCWGEVFDPLLCGFDPLARKPTKQDGKYCFEIFPMREDDVTKICPDYNSGGMSFSRDIAGYSWSFTNDYNERILLVCDFYKKKEKKFKLYKLANGKDITKEEYDENLIKFEEDIQKGLRIEQPAKIVAERWTSKTKICRYRFIENKVIEYKETDFEDLPLIFVDGNSHMIQKSEYGSSSQMTRPYVYHLKDTQKLKNFSGQCATAELQNMIQHKLIIAEEAICPQYADALINNQIPNVIVHKYLYNNNPNITIPPPREVIRTQIPAEILNTFSLCDNLSQVILGSFDAQQGNLNGCDLSGKAIIAGGIQANTAARPYIVGYLHAMNQLGKIFINMIPKLLITERTVPVVMKDGSRGAELINKKDGSGIQINYDPNCLNIRVEAGVNFEIQKQQANTTMISMAQNVPVFAQFLGEKGLPILVDNLTIKGADQLKQMASLYMQEIAQQKQQSMQMAQQNNPMALKQQELAMKGQQHQDDMKIEAAKVGISQQDADTERMHVMLQAKAAHEENLEKIERLQTEKYHSATELAIKVADHEHKSHIDRTELHHNINKDLVELHQKINEPENSNDTEY